MNSNETRIEPGMFKNNCPAIYHQSKIYTSSYKESVKKLEIDARGDRIYLHIEETSLDTGRTHNVTMTIPREIWNEYRKQLKEFDGSEI